MSGSPSLQDGKLIGAITHVLVNDPATGYGMFIENMPDTAGKTKSLGFPVFGDIALAFHLTVCRGRNSNLCFENIREISRIAKANRERDLGHGKA